MVAYYGMSENLKNICYYDSTGQQTYFQNPYSEHTAQVIDEEVKKMIAGQMARAKQILEEHKEGHHRMAELLIEKEVITSEDVEAILGPRQWKSRSDEMIEVNTSAQQESEEGLNALEGDSNSESSLSQDEARLNADSEENHATTNE